MTESVLESAPPAPASTAPASRRSSSESLTKVPAGTAPSTLPTPSVELLPRRLGDVRGSGDGPTLICLGGVHGNEPSGVRALGRIFSRLDEDATGLVGRLVGLTGNRQALARQQRFASHDLNRHWRPEVIARVRTATEPLYDEDREMLELEREILQIFDQARASEDSAIFAMDLHTTSGEGPGFAVLDDSLGNRGFALQVPITVVVGLEEELSGTITHHLDELGARVFGFEAGQHDDPRSIDHAEAAIWIAMEASGVLQRGSRPEIAAARETISALRGSLPHVVEVRYRHPVTPDDQFRMQPGFVNFLPVEKGQLLAHDRHGPIEAPESGMILMPLYQRQGEDGFFIVRTLVPSWLRLSARVRRWHLERFLHFLPGVEKHPERENAFRVDRKRARYLALELFHLLGYRRSGPRDSRWLTFYRRPNDD